MLYSTQSQEWLFPADSVSAHLVEHKKDRTSLSKWGNDLRQTYRTVAQATGIADLDIHLLMNHSVPGVNAGYVDRSRLLSDHLRLQQEMISQKIIEAVRGRSIGKMQMSANWPLLPARGALKDVLRRAEDGVVSSQLMAA